MKKDVHIYIDYDLNKKIESNARENGRTISEEYSRLVKYSLEFEKIFERLNLMNSSIRKIYSNTNFSRKLLEQLYADIITEPSDVKLSEALSEFKNNYKENKLNE